jgi:hypothetical protein
MQLGKAKARGEWERITDADQCAVRINFVSVSCSFLPAPAVQLAYFDFAADFSWM